MARRFSPLALIFLTIFIDLVGFGIVIPVLPLYAERFGASEVVVGVLLAIYSAMVFVCAPLLGRLSDRVGRRPVLMLSLLGTSIAFGVMGAAHALWILFAARILDGITGGNISTAQAYIADVTPPDQRARGMGLIGAAFGLGFIFGPAIGGVLSHISLAAPFYFASVLAIANPIALYFFLPESLPAERRGKGGGGNPIRDLVALSSDLHLRALFGTYFFGTMAFAMLTATFALFANHRFDFDATHTGYLFAFIGVIGAIIQGGLIGRLVARFGEKPLALTGLSIFGLSLFALPLVDTVPLLVLVSAGIAVGNSLVTPTLNTLASKSVNPFWQGRILGMMASVSSLARIIGPVLGGFLLGRDALGRMLHYGRTPYWASFALVLVAFTLALSVHARPQPATEAERPAETTG